MPCISQVRMGDRFKTTGRIESRGQLVGDRLIVDKAVSTGRANGLFVEALGIEFASFDPGDLGADERGTIFKILRAIFCPYFQLSVVRGQSLEMLLSSAGCGGIAGCGPGERAVEVIFRSFKTRWKCPKQQLRPQGGIDGCSPLSGKEARLQLAGPI